MHGDKHLVDAAIRDDLDIVQILLNNGTDINIPTSYEYPYTALQSATMMGYADIVMLLLDSTPVTLRYPWPCYPTALRLFASFLPQAQILKTAY